MGKKVGIWMPADILNILMLRADIPNGLSQLPTSRANVMTDIELKLIRPEKKQPYIVHLYQT